MKNIIINVLTPAKLISSANFSGDLSLLLGLDLPEFSPKLRVGDFAVGILPFFSDSIIKEETKSKEKNAHSLDYY